MNGSLTRVPCTIVTGFLGAGKTTLIRHVIANAQGRRLAVIVNEFGDVGIDGEILKGCGNAACPEENIVELANGCLCCTVADEFVPALDAILAAEPSFTAEGFLSGARAAYEMIVVAFAAGDLATLRRLLTPDALANFATAIQAREAAEQTMKTTLVSIDAADLVDARVAGAAATLAVRFAAKIVSATLDSAGAVIEGSTTTVVDHLDVWTFTRQLGARDPNWQLSATETVH